MRTKCKLLLLCAFLATGSVLKAQQGQQVEKNFEFGEIIRIAAAYQALPGLSFQSQIIIVDTAISSTDSTEVPSIDTIQGVYKMHDGRYWTMIDSIEYVQGYMYNLAVYHKEKIISVARPVIDNKLMQLGVLDSVFQRVFVQSITVTDIDSTTRSLEIEFYNEAPYKNYTMVYNKGTYFIQSVGYNMKKPNDSVATVRINTTFFNYDSGEVNPDYFFEGKYIFKDAEGIKAKPTYAGYQIITMDGDL